MSPPEKGTKLSLRRRAFLAAPLLGTMVFLIAVIYSVNLYKAESQSITQIGDASYHNKMVSMLELYRSDLFGFFADGLRQNAEDFISRYPWQDISDVQHFSSQERQDKCTKLSSTIQSQLIASSDPNNNFLKGLGDLLGALRNDYNFEGFKFSPVKFDPVEVPAADGSMTSVAWDFTCSGSGKAVCDRLLPGLTFDCNNYGWNLAHPYQCCSTPIDPNAPCSDQNVVRGCEQGEFYLAVNVSDPFVYRVMPRIQINDSAGNLIRTSALGTQAMLIPIRYPIFRYNDASFRIFAITQTGNDFLASQPELGSQASAPIIDYESYINANRDACQFLRDFTIDGTNPFKSISFSVHYQHDKYHFTCQNGIIDGGILDLSSAQQNAEATGNDEPIISPLNVTMIDTDPLFRVNKEQPNSYAAIHNIQFGT